jgi:8-oxo-dGTP pyrophosphatase MutT (NUDIX family)
VDTWSKGRGREASYHHTVPSSDPARRPRLTVVHETSAGGLVVQQGTEGLEAALIARRTRRGILEWVLPKGHVEEGETPEQAAVREVEEETGIHGRIIGDLGTLTYWFVADDRRVRKTVHHFLMRAESGVLSDHDVETELVEWLPLAEVRRRLAFADERALVTEAETLLAATS